MAVDEIKREGMDDLAAILKQSEIAKTSQPVIDEQTITGLSRVSEEAQAAMAAEPDGLPPIEPLPLPIAALDPASIFEEAAELPLVPEEPEVIEEPKPPAPQKRGWLRNLFGGKKQEDAPPETDASPVLPKRYDDPSSFRSALDEASIAHELVAAGEEVVVTEAPPKAPAVPEPPVAVAPPEPEPEPEPAPEPEPEPVQTDELLDMLANIDTAPAEEDAPPPAPEQTDIPFDPLDEPLAQDDDPFADYPIEFLSPRESAQQPEETDTHKKDKFSLFGFGKRKDPEPAAPASSSAWRSEPDPQEVYSQNYVREEGKAMEPRVERRYEPELAARSNVKLSTNTVLDVSVVIEGDISIENSIEIYGKIKGNLICKNNVFLGPDSVVEGGITAKSLKTEGGMIVGDIDCEENVVISNNCQITGNVNADSADIDGTVNGNIIMIGKLFLGPSSAINGDITSSRLVVEPGAAINGRCSTR